MNATLHTKSRQRGIAIVEFVIVLPILLLMMLAIAELGRALYQYNTLSKSVRDAARYYSTDVFVGSSTVLNDAAITNVENLIRYGNAAGTGEPLLPGDFDIEHEVETDASGTYVRVSASYHFDFLPGNPLAGIMALVGSAFPTELILTATTRMRVT